MDTTDPSVEWRRMQERYSQMSEDELQAVADEAYDLTDIARQVLRGEISSRKLAISLRETKVTETELELNPDEEDFDPSELELVDAHRVWDKEEAYRIKKIYEEAGIPSYLGPDNVENVDEFKGSFEDGVEFRIRSIDDQRAILAVRYALRNDPHPESEGPESDYRCPKCHSNEIIFEELEKESPDQPDFRAKFHWSCEACGHTWEDDGVEQGKNR